MGVKKFQVIMASIHWALHAQSHLTFQLYITDWKWGLPAVSQFRDLRRIRELGQWEEEQAWRGVPIGSGRGGLFLLQFTEAGDQPSSWRAPEAKKWRQLSKKSGGGGGRPHSDSARLSSFPYYVFWRASCQSGSYFMGWAPWGGKKHMTHGLWS